MNAIELIAFVSVFAAILAAYAIGTRHDTLPRTRLSGLRNIRQYTPPVDVFVEYKNAGGRNSLQRVRLLKSMCARDGRLYLLAVGPDHKYPRTFRTDRIACFATAEGEVLDTTRFLIERLAIPRELHARHAQEDRAKAWLPPISF